MSQIIRATKQLKYESHIVGTEYLETVDSVLTFEDSIPASSTNLLKDIADIQHANLKFFAIYSSDAINIYANDASTGVPDDSWLMKKDLPLVWGNSFSFEALPWAAALVTATAISTLYFTNALAVAVTVKIIAGHTV